MKNKVLIVDDNRTMRLLLESALKDEYVLEVVDSGLKAIEATVFGYVA